MIAYNAMQYSESVWEDIVLRVMETHHEGAQ